jgi:hypothetical protein
MLLGDDEGAYYRGDYMDVSSHLLEPEAHEGSGH